MIPRPPISTRTDALCPSTPLFRSLAGAGSYTWRAFSLAFASWWIHVYASIQALRRRPSRFVVTPKHGTDGRQLKAVWPSLVALAVLTARSEERRVGKECVSTCKSRWAPYHLKKK